MVVIRSHDALVRFIFSDPEQMAELLRAHLPPALVAAIDWSTLRRLDGSFVDEALRERQTDMLFEVRMGAATVLFYVLHEHKSWHDPFTSLQLARYSVRILDRWLAENPGQKKLPAILPFVLHHGDRPWQAPRCLIDLIDLRGCEDQVARFLLPLQLQLRFHLLDLAALDEEQIDAMRLSAVGDLTLRFLQFLRRRSPEQAAKDILRWQHLVVRVLGHPRGKEVISALL